MNIVAAMFFVLYLTLVVIGEEDDAKKVAEDFCAVLCVDKKETAINSNCKESCALS